MPDDRDAGGVEAEVTPGDDGNSVTIRLIASGRGIPLGTFLNAMSAPLRMLRELDRSISDGPATLEWRIVGASYNSPLTLQLLGIPIHGAIGTGGIGVALLDGLAELEAGGEPRRFSDAALEGAKQFIDATAARGFAGVEFACPGRPAVLPTAATAKNVVTILRKRYYFEHTTLDGRLDTIDVHKKHKFVIYDPLTRLPIICFFGEEFLDDAKKAIGERVLVGGRTKFSRTGQPISMEVEAMRRLIGSDEIPEYSVDRRVDITGGIDSVEYVRRMRDAE